MAGLEKIISQIRNESEEAAAGVVAAAEEKAQQILEQAKAEADEECAGILESSKRMTEEILKRGRSAADLKVRQGILAKKQELIGQVLSEALKEVKNLEAERYFDAVVKLAAESAMEGHGTIYFSEADLKRLPEGLEERMNAAAAGKKAVLTIASEPREIEGGFVLSYGGIEENCSFDAIFDSAREQLQDVVHKILFP